ncbi:MAG: NAD(P)/FAD-dependent oxidoreductase [Anaerolineae bacterium]|nr:NAD(P)/FAD-dependent oxidoreductase [Anaerolineae bacterium]
MTQTFDTIIVGGGPAGLSAAIYLGRFRRSVLIVDQASGRWDTAEVNENYFGFPQGIHTRQLRDLGLQQAQKFGAVYINASVSGVQSELHGAETRFIVQSSAETYLAKTVIIATGVRDHYSGLPEHSDYLGTSLFWCITCDGYKTIDKNIVLIGNNDDVACTTLQFLNYTHKLTLVTNATTLNISARWQAELSKFNVPVVCKKVTGLEGQHHQIHHVVLEDGQKIAADMVFNEQGAEPNSELAVRLGVAVDEKKYILTNDEQRTNIPLVYAAGDVTRLYSHQIVTAAHEGSMAAQAANYDLYLPHQRL